MSNYLKLMRKEAGIGIFRDTDGKYFVGDRVEGISLYETKELPSVDTFLQFKSLEDAAQHFAIRILAANLMSTYNEPKYTGRDIVDAIDQLFGYIDQIVKEVKEYDEGRKALRALTACSGRSADEFLFDPETTIEPEVSTK